MQISNEKKNVFYGILFQFLTLVFGFVIRKLLVDNVGVYLIGINGVYENIISMLSLMNFGIGSSCIYYLYKSFSNNDFDSVVKYYKSFRKLFRFVAVGVFFLGCIVIININWIINIDGQISVIYLRIFFLIHLAKATITYLITCPRYVLQCDEKRYYDLRADIIALILFGIAKAYALINFKDYIVYLILCILETVFANLYIFISFKKQYRNIDFNKKINYDKSTKEILSYSKYLAFGDINHFINNCTDNILLSKICGTITVGLMSNYYLIIDAIKGFSMQFFSSIEATIIKKINLSITKKDYISIYENVLLISYTISSFVSIFLFALTDLFIKWYFGFEFSIGSIIPLLMTISLIIYIFQYPSAYFLTANGLNDKTVIFSSIMAISNILFSIILGIKIGEKGILLGTIIANSIFLFGQEYVLHKYLINFSFSLFLKKSVYFILLALELFVTKNLIYKNCDFFSIVNLSFKCFLVWTVFMIPFLKKIANIFNGK